MKLRTRYRSPATAAAAAAQEPELSLEARRARLILIRKSLKLSSALRRGVGMVGCALVPAVLLVYTFAIVLFEMFPGTRYLFVVCLSATPGAAYVYWRMGHDMRAALRKAIATNEPAAAGCIAARIRQHAEPYQRRFLAELENMVAGVGKSEWELMTNEDVSCLIACAADRNTQWAERIGMASARSASEHGEIRAIPALKRAISNVRGPKARRMRMRAELTALLQNLEAEAAAREPSNLLLRPADGSPELLRVASDAGRANDRSILVRPADADSGSQMLESRSPDLAGSVERAHSCDATAELGDG